MSDSPKPYHTSPTRWATLPSMTRHAYIADKLGDRIKTLRKERGWTQTDLAERAGCSRRAIVYYERDGKYPPAPVLAAMAGAFGLDINTFMDPEEPKRMGKTNDPDLLNNPDDRRLWRRFSILRTLPDRDQQAVFRLLDSIAKGHEAEAVSG